jgi:hypothetical protein
MTMTTKISKEKKMTKTTMKVAQLPFEGKDGETLLSISVAYAKGGYNYLSNKNETGGFYVHITPVKLERGWEVYTMGAGYKVCVEPAQRFNAKTGTMGCRLHGSRKRKKLHRACSLRIWKNGITHAKKTK